MALSLPPCSWTLVPGITVGGKGGLVRGRGGRWSHAPTHPPPPPSPPPRRGLGVPMWLPRIFSVLSCRIRKRIFWFSCAGRTTTQGGRRTPAVPRAYRGVPLTSSGRTRGSCPWRRAQHLPQHLRPTTPGAALQRCHRPPSPCAAAGGPGPRRAPSTRRPHCRTGTACTCWHLGGDRGRETGVGLLARARGRQPGSGRLAAVGSSGHSSRPPTQLPLTRRRARPHPPRPC